MMLLAKTSLMPHVVSELRSFGVPPSQHLRFAQHVQVYGSRLSVSLLIKGVPGLKAIRCDHRINGRDDRIYLAYVETPVGDLIAGEADVISVVATARNVEDLKTLGGLSIQEIRDLVDQVHQAVLQAAYIK